MKKKYLRALAKAAAVRAIKTVAQPFWGLLTGVSLSVHPPLLACCLC